VQPSAAVVSLPAAGASQPYEPGPVESGVAPAAAAKLADILDKLRKGTDARKSRLASVRAMTSAKSATG
jgi:hypothetical protein